MRSKLIIVVVAAVLAACQTTQGTHQIYPPATGPQGEPLPAVTPPAGKPVEPQAATPVPAAPAIDYPKSSEQISGGAVTALMKQARQYRDAGQPDRAAGVLERALRIEPRNYFVWSALGQSYLGQKNYLQAESVAQKSNALARGNLYVNVENWKTIAAARQARGDAEGALQASAQVETIQAQLNAAPATP
ncbi:MAG: tetratricopeptide repeat protein [Solimonas sp.]